MRDGGAKTAPEKWNAELKRQSAVRQYPKWPNEAMLKILFGGSNYLKTPFKPSPDWRVLDVGCGFANNLVPFADIGCECHGVDLHPEMATQAKAVMEERGYTTEIQVGSNRALPYPDAHFDLLLSINTLHYEGSEPNILAAFKEFRRVLKPGGGLYLSTVGPEHEIYRRAMLLGHHRYRVQNFDFRDGEEFFFFDSERYLRHYSEQIFADVETGRVTEKLMKLPLDFLVALCR
jgi:SAM-dependent methyltransferase